MATKLEAMATEAAAKPCLECLDKDVLVEQLRKAIAEAQALAQTVTSNKSLDHPSLDQKQDASKPSEITNESDKMM